MNNKTNNIFSLQVSIIVVLIAGILVFTFIFMSISRAILPYILSQMEKEYMSERENNVQELFKKEYVYVENVAGDMAIWKSTAAFIEGNEPDYIANYWYGKSPAECYNIDYILFKDRDGILVHGESRIQNPERLPEFWYNMSHFVDKHCNSVLKNYKAIEISQRTFNTVGKTGILLYQEIPYLVSIMPVVNYLWEQEDPVGTLVFITALNSAYFQQLTSYNDTHFNIRTRSFTAHDIVTTSSNFNVLSIAIPLETMNDEPLILEIESTYAWYDEVQKTLNNLITSLIIGYILFSVIIYFIIALYFIQPMKYLVNDISEITAHDRLDKENYAATSEFETLSTSINTMLDKLEETSVSMTLFQKVLNELGAGLIVIDINTHDVLFFNEYLKKDLHLEPQDIGRKCWEVLQHIDSECTSCYAAQLLKQDINSGEKCINELKSPISNRYYKVTTALINWDSHNAFIQHIVDINDLKIAESTVKKRLQQQELLSAIFQSFLSKEVSFPINDVLLMTGMFMNVSTISIAELDVEKQQLHFIHEWLNPREYNSKSVLNKPFYHGPGDGIYENIVTKGAPYIICNDIQQSIQFTSFFTVLNVQAFIAVPIFIYKSLWGYIFIGDCTGQRYWDMSDIQLLRLIATSIASYIIQCKTEEQILQMSSIVNSSPQYIGCIEIPECTYQYLNPGALSISGYSKEELMIYGQSILFSKETNNYFLERIQNLKEGRLQIDLPLRKKNGEERFFSFAVFIMDKNKNIFGIIGNDVTEKQKLEQELIAAKEVAEESSRTKSSFLSRMSHEMRTPMNAIIGMTTIAQNSHDMARMEYCLTRVNEASVHLLGVINDILDMSKIESGRFELSYTQFDFEKMLIRITNIMNFRVDEKHQNIIVNLDSAIPKIIISDEQRLAQVITNLISNAIKFTPEKGTITVSAINKEIKETEENIVYTIKFSVTDTGIGITKEQQQRLFSSFQQADGSITRKYGGTGLGLAISKNIIEMMGGEIWIESEKGEGATFVFEIPVEAGIERQEKKHNPVWSELRILVVDDSEDILEYFRYFAASMGIVCETASDGDEAYNLIETTVNLTKIPFDIIFVDWRMPVMNGIEFTRKIKRKYGNNAVIIMISAVEWETLKEEAQDAGVDGFVSKPLFSSTLVDCINSHLATGEPIIESNNNNEENINGIFENKHVLLVEDVEINREIVSALLEETGVDLDYAENGKESIEKFEEHPSYYDVILMDISMPEMDGFEATTRIRALPISEARTVPIIAMTANVFREDIEKCLSSGMNDHIGKPINIDELIEKLKIYINYAAKH
ncbi:MAG: response regulator [Treponema sp.]|jgi:PAS domain S-box-containing protein|nr:response regulator [Treponema sp.]